MSRCARMMGVTGLVFLAACGEKPRAPTGPSPPPASVGPAAPTAIRLDGPSSLALGTSAQYRVTVSFTDGTARDVTNQSTIVAHSFGPSGQVLNVADGGLVTGSAQGEGNLIARYPPGIRTDESITFPAGTLASSPLRVLVLEPGTFRVSGTVTESQRPFPGVRVTVVGGRRAGLQVPTDTDGTYVLYGLAGPTELGVSEEGLQRHVRSIVVNDHQVVDFNLQPIPGYTSLTGDWRLTLTASRSCGSAVPSDAARRTLQARIVQRGPQLTLEVSSPQRVILEGYPSTALGGVSGETASFRFQADGPEERNPPRWTLLEMLEPGRFLGIGALGGGERSGNTITGTLSGTFAIYRNPNGIYLSPGTVLESSCYRKIGEHPELHSFRLERN